MVVNSSATDQPLVSVIIPTFNSGERLIEAVRCVLNQDYPNVELIVVDDGSHDGVASRLQAFLGRLTLIEQANLGVANARNHGCVDAGATWFTSSMLTTFSLPTRFRASCDHWPLIRTHKFA